MKALPSTDVIRARTQSFLHTHQCELRQNALLSIQKLIHILNKKKKPLVYEYFRKVHQFDLEEKLEKINTFCQNKKAHPIMGKESLDLTWNRLNLSVCSSDIAKKGNDFTISGLKKALEPIIMDKETYYFGGYGEPRPFYQSKIYKTEIDNQHLWRTVHLGLDIWERPDASIYAPYDGIVTVCQYYPQAYDYGHVLIQEVVIDECDSFYILYGHLSKEILQMYKPGDRIVRGEFLASIGDENENGNWPPHLHVQIITDMLWEGNIPEGVAISSDWKIWKRLCPNPEKILQLHVPQAQPIVMKNFNFIKRTISNEHPEIVLLCRSYQQYLYDINGQRYLNFGLNPTFILKPEHFMKTNEPELQSKRNAHVMQSIIEYVQSKEYTNIEVADNAVQVFIDNNNLLEGLIVFLHKHSILTDNSGCNVGYFTLRPHLAIALEHVNYLKTTWDLFDMTLLQSNAPI